MPKQQAVVTGCPWRSGRSRLICQPSSRTGENPPYGMIGEDRGNVGIIRSPVRASIPPDRSWAISAPLLDHGVRKRKAASTAQLGRGSGSDGVADESFSKFPHRTRRPMRTGDDGLERLLDPTAILIRDRE